MKIVWLGHSSVLIEDDKKILIDPFKINLEEKVDIILITHDHYDHCDLESIKRVAKKDTIFVTTVYAYEKIKDFARNYRLVNPLHGSWIIEDFEIKPTWAYNINKPYHPKGKGVGFIIKKDNLTLYHMGDTDIIPEIFQIKEKIDVLFIPLDEKYAMNKQEAQKVIEYFNPKYYVFIHRPKENKIVLEI